MQSKGGGQPTARALTRHLPAMPAAAGFHPGTDNVPGRLAHDPLPSEPGSTLTVTPQPRDSIVCGSRRWHANLWSRRGNQGHGKPVNPAPFTGRTRRRQGNQCRRYSPARQAEHWRVASLRAPEWRMSQAFFAIAGAIVGVLGTVLTALVGARHEEQRIWREALRSVCANLTAQVSELQDLSHQLRRTPGNPDLQQAAEQTHTRARGFYEQLRLTSKSAATQEASR